MDNEEIIWIVVGVAVLLALVALALMLSRKAKAKKQERQRRHATELRNEAQHHAQGLPDAELRAQEERVKAEKLRLEAERAQERAQEAETGYLQQAATHEDKLREADRVDPDAGGGTHKRT